LLTSPSWKLQTSKSGDLALAAGPGADTKIVQKSNYLTHSEVVQCSARAGGSRRRLYAAFARAATPQWPQDKKNKKK